VQQARMAADLVVYEEACALQRANDGARLEHRDFLRHCLGQGHS